MIGSPQKSESPIWGFAHRTTWPACLLIRGPDFRGSCSSLLRRPKSDMLTCWDGGLGWHQSLFVTYHLPIDKTIITIVADPVRMSLLLQSPDSRPGPEKRRSARSLRASFTIRTMISKCIAVSKLWHTTTSSPPGRTLGPPWTIICLGKDYLPRTREALTSFKRVPRPDEKTTASHRQPGMIPSTCLVQTKPAGAFSASGPSHQTN